MLYAIICIVAALILLSPGRSLGDQTPASAGLQFQDATFQSRAGAVPIAAWFIPDSRNKAVVLVHGKGANRSAEFQGHFLQFAADLHARGFNVLVIDLRGHGSSGRAFLTFGINEKGDVESAVDWLKMRGFAPQNIGVIGISLGGASALMAAAEDPDIAAVVADSSYSDIYPVIAGAWRGTSGLPEFFLFGARAAARVIAGTDVASAKPVLAISRVYPRPVLLIHGTSDRLIPIEQARELKQADPQAELWEVSGAGHARAYQVDPKAYINKVAGFLDGALGKAQ